MTDRQGDEPIEQQYVGEMRFVAKQLDHLFNGDLRGQDRPTGFVLLVFPFGDATSNRCNFISNGGKRDELAAMMRAVAARIQAEQEDTK